MASPVPCPSRNTVPAAFKNPSADSITRSSSCSINFPSRFPIIPEDVRHSAATFDAPGRENVLRLLRHARQAPLLFLHQLRRPLSISRRRRSGSRTAPANRGRIDRLERSPRPPPLLDLFHRRHRRRSHRLGCIFQRPPRPPPLLRIHRHHAHHRLLRRLPLARHGPAI